MIALGFELGSLANETWQIVLTLGVITGIGQSALWVPAMSTIVQWFLLKRGLVVGIVAAGTGLGGLALAPLSQSLIDNLGWRNALRVMGALTGTMISLGGALLFTRFGKENRIDLKFWEKKDPVAEAEKAAKKAAKKKDPFFDPGFFKNPTFVKLYVFAMIQPFAFLFPYTYVPSYAVNIGLSANVGAICLALMNGFSSFGRIFFGWTADKYLGNINSYILCLILPPILALTMWTTCFSQAQLMAFASLYGEFEARKVPRLQLTFLCA
jgi:MFS family permease